MARAGGGGRGGSGAGRGFSGGGSRGFGGRTGGSAGGSFQRGGVSGGSRPSTGGLGGSAPRRPAGGSAPRPGGGFGFGGQAPRGGPGYGPGYGYGPGFGPGRYPPPPPPRRRRGWFGGPGYYGGGGCFTLVVVTLVGVLLAALLLGMGPVGGTQQSTNSDIGKSTVTREKLPDGVVNETGYYQDNLGWVLNSQLLVPGMEKFYQKTGVQPYLYLTQDINGNTNPTDAEAQAFANELYDDLFTDEAHFLLIFQEYQGVYHTWYLAGSAATTVMDTEASNILLDYIDRYYYTQNISDEEVFSKSFEETASRIMSVTRSPWLAIVIIAAVVVVLLLVFVWWQRSRRQREMQDARTAEILNTPLETFGDSRLDQLEDKYNGR